MTYDIKPNWGKWRSVIVVELYEAVALSMNLEPNSKHPQWREIRSSPTYQDRLFIVSRSLEKVGLLGSDSGPPDYWRITLPLFAALARDLEGEVPVELLALAEPDKRDIEILDLRRQVGTLTQERDKLRVEVPIKKSLKQSEAAQEQHARTRERTLAAVLATIATADRKDYINKTDQKIVVTKLAGLVEDNRTKYEKLGKILSVEKIKNLVGKIVNGDYFP